MRPRWSSGPEEINLVRHAESMGNLAGARAHDVDAVLVSGCGSGDLFELAGFADTTAVDKADADVTREPSQGGRGAQVPAIVAELA